MKIFYYIIFILLWLLKHSKVIYENNVHIIFFLGNLHKQAMLSSRFLFHFIIVYLLCQLSSLLCKQFIWNGINSNQSINLLDDASCTCSGQTGPFNTSWFQLKPVDDYQMIYQLKTSRWLPVETSIIPVENQFNVSYAYYIHYLFACFHKKRIYHDLSSKCDNAHRFCDLYVLSQSLTNILYMSDHVLHLISDVKIDILTFVINNQYKTCIILYICMYDHQTTYLTLNSTMIFAQLVNQLAFSWFSTGKSIGNIYWFFNWSQLAFFPIWKLVYWIDPSGTSSQLVVSTGPNWYQLIPVDSTIPISILKPVHLTGINWYQ